MNVNRALNRLMTSPSLLLDDNFSNKGLLSEVFPAWTPLTEKVQKTHEPKAKRLLPDEDDIDYNRGPQRQKLDDAGASLSQPTSRPSTAIEVMYAENHWLRKLGIAPSLKTRDEFANSDPIDTLNVRRRSAEL